MTAKSTTRIMKISTPRKLPAIYGKPRTALFSSSSACGDSFSACGGTSRVPRTVSACRDRCSACGDLFSACGDPFPCAEERLRMRRSVFRVRIPVFSVRRPFSACGGTSLHRAMFRKLRKRSFRFSSEDYTTPQGRTQYDYI